MADLPGWVRTYFAKVDELSGAHLDMCTDDVTVRFGNNPPVTGLDDARRGLAAFRSHFSAMRHELTSVMTDGTTVVVEAEVTYTLPSGRTVTVPSASVLHRRDGLIDRLAVYADLTPVLAEP